MAIKRNVAHKQVVEMCKSLTFRSGQRLQDKRENPMVITGPSCIYIGKIDQWFIKGIFALYRTIKASKSKEFSSDGHIGISRR